MKYVIDIPDEVKWIQYIQQTVCGTLKNLKAEFVSNLIPYTEPDEDEIRQKVINEICSKFAANEYYYGDALKSAFICMAEGKDVGQVKCFNLGATEDRIKQKVEQEVWEFVRGLFISQKTNLANYNECYHGKPLYMVITDLTYEEAKAKYEAWKKEKDKIRVGDEVENASHKKGIVFNRYISPSSGLEYVRVLYMGDGNSFISAWEKNDVCKTGRHFDEVAELLKKMSEDT